MELFQELFMTAFAAFIFSFIVAKLVSNATAGDDVRRDSSHIVNDTETVVLTEEVKFDRGLKVHGTKSKKRVRFVETEVVEKVDEVEGDDASVKELEELRCGEEFCDVAGRIAVEESSREVSHAVELLEGGFDVEEEAVEMVGGFESRGHKEENVESAVEGLVVEEKSESSKADGFDRVKKENMVKEKIGNEEVDDEIVVKSTIDDAVVHQIEEATVMEGGENKVTGIRGGLNEGAEEKVGIEGGLNEGDEEKEGLVSDDDDWEGIERSELEKAFLGAANYVDCGDKDDRLSNAGSDVQMQLYGLHKVAMEGPCHESQPMALKLSARAKWNAWQRLGNMSPEAAMEQYISLLSDKVPGWMQGDSDEDGKTDSSEAGIPGGPDPNMTTFLDTQPNSEEEKKLELKFGANKGDLSGGSNFINKDKE